MDAATRQLVTGLDPRLHASIERFVLLVLAREEIDVEVRPDFFPSSALSHSRPNAAHRRCCC